MKRIVALLLILSMFGLASCGNDSEVVPDVTDTAETTILDETTFAPEETTENSNEKESLPSLPNEYIEVIEDYKNIVEYRLSDSFESEWNNGNFGNYDKYYNADIQGDFDYMIVEMLPYGDDITVSSYGYVLRDINSDDTPELFWVSSDLNTIFAIFTIVDGEAQLVDAFWSRYRCVITDKGEIYTRGSSGASYTTYELRELDKSSAALTTVNEFGTGYDEERNSALYYVSEGEKEYISKERFDELLSEYPFENGEEWMHSRYFSLTEENISMNEAESIVKSLIINDCESRSECV